MVFKFYLLFSNIKFKKIFKLQLFLTKKNLKINYYFYPKLIIYNFIIQEKFSKNFIDFFKYPFFIYFFKNKKLTNKLNKKLSSFIFNFYKNLDSLII